LICRGKMPFMKNYRVSSAELAQFLDLAERSVRHYRATGVFVLARDPHGRPLRGRYDLKESVRAYVQHMREKAKSGDSSESERQELRTRKLRAETEIAELQLRLLKGELHRTDDLLFILTNRITEARSHLLAIPARVATRLQGETSEQTISRIVYSEIEGALRRISELKEGDFAEQSQKYLRSISAGNGNIKRSARRAIPKHGKKS
jgi:phage terminase Nu1 subunit (DNA packaging protein)